MKHLGFVGKSTEYIGYTYVEIINSSLRLSFNVPSKSNVDETFSEPYRVCRRLFYLS